MSRLLTFSTNESTQNVLYSYVVKLYIYMQKIILKIKSDIKFHVWRTMENSYQDCCWLQALCTDNFLETGKELGEDFNAIFLVAMFQDILKMSYQGVPDVEQ